MKITNMTRERCLILLFMVLGVALAVADTPKAYTPAQLHDLHAQDASQFIIDPAGRMGASAREKANGLLRQTNDSTKAMVAVAIVPSIGEADINEYAKQLYSRLKLGKGGKGMLVLFDMAGQQVRIHPGRGLEGTFTNVACHRLINEIIIPPMKTGDLDDAVIDLSDKIYQAMTDPEVADEIRMPTQKSSGGMTLNLWYFALIPLIAAIWFYSSTGKRLWRLHGESAYEKARDLHDGSSPVVDIVLCVCTLGLAIPGVLLLRLAAGYYRNKSRKCDVCGTRMKKLSEQEDNKYLSESQNMEEEIKSVDYDVWLCPSCGATEIFPFPERNTDYTHCPACHAKAMRLLYKRVERPATSTRKGRGESIYECRHCGERETKTYDIPIPQSHTSNT